jgi:chemotaxis protein CheD
MSAVCVRHEPDVPPRAGERIHVLQGQFAVSADPEVMLTTILGSCVAACIRDAGAGVGGMNHFLLPDSEGRDQARAMSYGVHSMELLVNALLGAGAKREALEAKLFGGGQLTTRLADVGKFNAEFAQGFLKREGIAYLGGSLGGPVARRIQFWPVSGRARQLVLTRGAEHILELERRASRRAAPGAGAVELF